MAICADFCIKKVQGRPMLEMFMTSISLAVANLFLRDWLR